MKPIFSLTLALLILLTGCEKDEPAVPTKGDIYVTVKHKDGTLVENANVYTRPESVQGVTDMFGTVLLKGVEKGNIEVVASLGNIGSGKALAEVVPDELTRVDIEILRGVDDGMSPHISISSPVAVRDYSFGDSIVFSAVVTDGDTPPADISVVWESDIDGILNTASPGSNGMVTFTNTTLSKGEHTIKVTAEDADGFKSIAVFTVRTLNPLDLELKEVSITEGGVKVVWSQYEGDDFSSYEIYRSAQGCFPGYLEPLGVINNVGETVFIDEVPPLEYQACYTVRVTNTYNRSRFSNYISVDNPCGVVFNFVPNDMLLHPSGQYIYLVSKSTQKIVKYDFENDTVVKEITLQGTVGYCDIGDNGYGVELYVPATNGRIYVYNADDLSLSATITTDLSTASVVIDGKGHVIASVAPSPWWEQPVRTFSRANGMYIDGYESGGVNENDRLRRIPGTSEIISISTSVSPVDMEYFLIADDGTIQAHHDDKYHGDYPLHPGIFRISDDGSYIITSYNGSVYLANSNMAYQGNLQNGGLSYIDFAFSADGKTIYAATGNRKSIQIGHYPSLIRDNEIMLKGYPRFLVRDDNRLIVSIRSDQENTIKSGIEVIDIP